MRRAALNPFFSKSGVYRLESVVQEKVDLTLDKLREFRESGRVIPLNAMFAAFTNGELVISSVIMIAKMIRLGV